jgi:hypothetical protein
MSIAFLIDECLSPELAQLAHEHGYVATAMRDRGWAGHKDDDVVQHCLAWWRRSENEPGAALKLGHPTA